MILFAKRRPTEFWHQATRRVCSVCAILPTHCSDPFLAGFQLLPRRGCTSAWLVSLCIGLAGCRRVEIPSSIDTSATIQSAIDGDDSETSFESTDAEIVLEEPTVSQPVAAGISIVPKQIRPGESVTVVVRVKTAPGWHIYPPDRPTGAAQPVSLQLELADDWAEQGEWEYPPAVRNPHGDGFIYEGELTFRHMLRATATAASGPVAVKCQFRYQACDPFSCRPPATLTLEATAVLTNQP